jgi:dihydrolipoamide dehydrogenase
MDEVKALAAHGIAFGEPQIDLAKLRGVQDKVVGKLTGGLAGMAKARKVDGRARASALPRSAPLEVSCRATAGPGEKVVRFDKAIIAAGSQAVKLPFMPDDPRVVDSTGALELKAIPKRMLVIGGGIIGLEMATVYSTLGTRIDVVEMLDGLMLGADRDLVKVWEKKNAPRFDKVMLKTKTVVGRGDAGRHQGGFEGEKAPAKEPQLYDLVLVAVGRSPNGKKIGAEKAGVAVTDRGFIPVDKQMRTNVPHIFAIGDIVGQPMLAHKAVHEAHVAAEAAAGRSRTSTRARSLRSPTPIRRSRGSGLTEDDARRRASSRQGRFPWAASGRAIANGRDEGFTKLLFDEATHRCSAAASSARMRAT